APTAILVVLAGGNQLTTTLVALVDCAATTEVGAGGAASARFAVPFTQATTTHTAVATERSRTSFVDMFPFRRLWYCPFCWSTMRVADEVGSPAPCADFPAT